jgi:hypothetical protein
MSPLGVSDTLDVLGFFVPAIFLWALISVPLYAAARWGLARIDAYRFIWHRALFNTALYVLILGAVMTVGGTTWL